MILQESGLCDKDVLSNSRMNDRQLLLFPGFYFILTPAVVIL